MVERFLATWRRPRGIVLRPGEVELTRAVFAGEPVDPAALEWLTVRLEAAPIVG